MLRCRLILLHSVDAGRKPNRSLTRAAQHPVPSHDREGVVYANFRNFPPAADLRNFTSHPAGFAGHLSGFAGHPGLRHRLISPSFFGFRPPHSVDAGKPNRSLARTARPTVSANFHNSPPAAELRNFAAVPAWHSNIVFF